MNKDIIVIGASAGGLEALKTLVAAFPRDFPGALFVVLHSAPNSPGILSLILEKAGALPAVKVAGREEIEPGRVYVPASDHHLIVERGFVRATRGPKENRFRPAVDPLFRSAAVAYGPRVIGVILTGGLDDGTAGLGTVKQLGGTAVVQDPSDAAASSMPRSALQHVEVDYCLPLSEIGLLLVRLSGELAATGAYAAPEHTRIEVDIAAQETALDAGVLKLGEPSYYTCPECHGTLLTIKEGNQVRFRCHTGHAYSVESLLTEINDAVEIALWNAIRAIEESQMLLGKMARQYESAGKQELANELRRRAEQTLHRAATVRGVLNSPWAGDG